MRFSTVCLVIKTTKEMLARRQTGNCLFVKSSHRRANLAYVILSPVLYYSTIQIEQLFFGFFVFRGGKKTPNNKETHA